MEEGSSSIQHVLSKLGIWGGKTMMRFGEGKCSLLHVGCYAHMEQVTPAQALRTAKTFQWVISL